MAPFHARHREINHTGMYHVPQHTVTIYHAQSTQAPHVMYNCAQSPYVMHNCTLSPHVIYKCTQSPSHRIIAYSHNMQCTTACSHHMQCDTGTQHTVSTCHAQHKVTICSYGTQSPYAMHNSTMYNST
jgi:hypothetical protein